jgi:pre-mRNA-processing factor 17
VVEKLKPEELTEEQKEYAAYRKQKRNERRAARGQPPEEGDEEEERTDKSFFHGKQSEDYKGDSWLVPPKDKKKENDHCYIPKKWIHTWYGDEPNERTPKYLAAPYFPSAKCDMLLGRSSTT